MSPSLSASKGNRVLQRIAVATALCLGALIVGYFVAPTVTFDSWQYLSSGLSIARGAFPDGYFLIREPLYPLLIGVVIWLNLPLQAVVSIQFLLFSLSSIMLWSTLRSAAIPAISGPVGAFVLILGTALIGGYSAFVGQQTLLFFLVSLGIWLTNKVRQGTSRGLYLSFLVGLLFGIGSIFLIFFLGLLTISLLVLMMVWRERRDSAGLRELTAVAVLLIGAMLAGGVWHFVRTSMVEFESQVRAEAIVNAGVSGPYDQVLRAGIPPETAVLTSFLANLDLSPNQGWGLDTMLKQQLPGSPNFYFGTAPWFGLNDPCVVRPPQTIPFVTPETLDLFVNCEVVDPQRANSALKAGWALAHLLGTTFLLSGLLLWRRRAAPEVTLIWASAVSFALGYALLLGGIPRYGMPSQMFLLFLGGAFLTPVINQLSHKLRHRKPFPLADHPSFSGKRDLPG